MNGEFNQYNEDNKILVMTKYALTIWAIGRHADVDISQNIFNQLKQSRICLNNCLAIEEKYELLLSNYLELEKECLNISFDSMVTNANEYEDFFEIRISLNRRVINLLTTTKLYIDQIQQHIKACFLDHVQIIDKVKEMFSYEYDSCFEYRFMEALRNYAQHRGLAVHSTSQSAKKVEVNGVTYSKYNLSAFTHKSEVVVSSKFKKSVSSEMLDKVDLINASRIYIESITKVHCFIREQLNPLAEQSRSFIASHIDNYIKESNSSNLGLTVISYTPNTEHAELKDIIDRFPLILDWDNIRIKLIKKNGSLINLNKRYVTSNSLN